MSNENTRCSNLVTNNAIIGNVVINDAVLGGATINGVVINRPTYPNYEGDYEVTPRVEDIILETKERSMQDDLTILAIPYYETTNLSGGYTAIIGG